MRPQPEQRILMSAPTRITVHLSLPQVLLDAYEKLMPVYKLLKRFPAESSNASLV